MSEKPAFLVVDIESVVDGRLVQRVRYPDEPALTPAAAVARLRAQLLETSGGKSDFIPHTYHLPISVAIAKVDAHGALMEVRTLDRPRFRPQVIARSFWKGWQTHGHPTLVTFNGRFFDIPVMELAAFRYGLAVPSWFTTSGPSYQQPRNRYNVQAHLDLQDAVSNFGAVTVSGGLNLCAQLLGKPGKLDTKGSMVQELWEQGERERIDDYCMCDCLDTYFVFLRSRVLGGHISLDEEQKLVQGAKAWISQAAASNTALAAYLQHFQHWSAPTDDEDPFVKAPVTA